MRKFKNSYLLQFGPKPLYRGENMDIIAQLKIERDKATQQVHALDMAIEALSGTATKQGPRGRRTMSAATRGRISAAQKARYAAAWSPAVNAVMSAACAFAAPSYRI